MRGVFLAGALVGIGLMVGLAAAGGVGYSREVDYVECERFAVPLAEVSIRPSRLGSIWGNAGFLEFAHYGPPYDLRIQGTLDDGDNATAFEITDLTVEADGVPVLSLPRVVVPVEEVRAVPTGGDHPRIARGYMFPARAFTAATPRRLRVAGTLSRLGPTRDKGLRFSHDFEARRTHHLVLGRWSWTF
jgi:hypothetical protein